MRKYLTALILAAVTTICSLALDVRDIPNVQIHDSSRHLVNPDGIISAEAQMRIDTLISGVRSRTTAELSVVVLNSLDGEDPDLFATELFEKWGIGKKDKDNGLLILVSLEDRSVTLRTGYGLEGVLPDIYLKHLVEDSLYTRMRERQYDLGIESTLKGIAGALDNPETVKEIISAREERHLRHQEESFSELLHNVAIWMVSITVIMLFLFIYLRASYSRKQKNEAYYIANRFTIGSLAMTFVGLGLPVLVYLLARHWRDSIRNTPPVGPSGKKMEKIGMPAAIGYMTPAEATETNIGSMEYDIWRDPVDGSVKKYRFNGPAYSLYSVCGRCGARAVKKSQPVVSRHATVSHTGEMITNSTCLHCGNMTQKRTVIPKVMPVIINSGRGFGGGGGGFSGGSFGGGSTGGGGFSGRW